MRRRFLATAVPVMLLALAAMTATATTACKGKDAAGPGGSGKSGKLTAADAQALRDMTRGLEAIDQADPRRKVMLLAELLSEVAGSEYAGFAALVQVDASQRMLTLVEKTDFACKKPEVGKAMSAAAEDKLAKLVEACSPEYYGLPAGQTQLMSVDWFIVQRTGAWLAQARAKAAGSADFASGPLDEAMKKSRFRLPLPLRAAGYAVPRSTQVVDLQALSYLIVGADQVRAAAMPSATLTSDGAKLADVPGGVFPGTPVPREIASLDPLVDSLSPPEPEDLPEEEEEREASPDESGGIGQKQMSEEGKMGKKDSARHEGQYRMKMNSDQRRLTKEQRIEEARKAGIVGVMPRQPVSFVGRDVRVRDGAPLVVADGALPAARVLEVIARLPQHGARLGVNGSGHVAMHDVAFGVTAALGRRGRGWGQPPLGLHLSIDDDGFALWTEDDLRRVARVGDSYDFGALIPWFQEHTELGMVFSVHVTGTKATVQDLAAVLDVAAVQGIWMVVLGDAPPAVPAK